MIDMTSHYTTEKSYQSSSSDWWWRDATMPWFHISLERKYEKLNRSGETESDFWNLQFLPPTRRLSIVSWAIRHQKENDCSACVGDVAIFKTRYSLTPTIKHSSYLTTAAVNIFNLLAKTMITDSRSDWFALLTMSHLSSTLTWVESWW